MKYQKRVNKDWTFTDQVHNNIMLNEFYKKFNLLVEKASREEDLSLGIDYWATLDKPEHKNHQRRYSFQERFRKKSKFTENSNEFTLRYKRKSSYSDKQNNSELFKIEAHYLLYGVINTPEYTQESRIEKYCVINIKKLKKAINEGLICIHENSDIKKPYIKNDKPVAVEITNHELSISNSSFLAFNILDIQRLVPGIILYDQGYSSPNLDRLIVKEHSSEKYPPRTYYNASSAGTTLALASDLNTAGEKLTAKAAGTKYIGFKINSDNNPLVIARLLYKKMMKDDSDTLNVAGNGIYTLSQYGYSQEQINQLVYWVIEQVHAYRPIRKIYTGGQTGVDIAGAVAGLALGIDTEVTLPKGYRQRFHDKDIIQNKETIEQQIISFSKKLNLKNYKSCCEIYNKKNKPRYT